MGSSPRSFLNDNDNSKDDDEEEEDDYDDDLLQELRDIAFKFSSAMTGVTETPARFSSSLFILFTLFIISFVNLFPTPITRTAPRWMTCTAKAVNAFGFAAAHEYIKVR